MRHTKRPLARGPSPALVVGLAVIILASCARPGPCCVPTAASPVSEPAPLPQAAPAAPVAAPAPTCADSAVQPSPGAAIYPLSRVAGCPGLVVVEHRGERLVVAVEVLLAAGLSVADLSGLPEEGR